MKYTLVVGSLRKGSFNRKLLSHIEKNLKKENLGEVTIIDSDDVSLPLYNQDIEEAGMPKVVEQMANTISRSDGIILCSPEYNGSISSPMKNFIDWVSRIRPMPFKGRPILLTGASPSSLGSMRGISHTRAPFEAVNAYVYPESFALSNAYEAFNDDDEIIDTDLSERLSKLLLNFNTFCQKMSHK